MTLNLDDAYIDFTAPIYLGQILIFFKAELNGATYSYISGDLEINSFTVNNSDGTQCERDPSQHWIYSCEKVVAKLSVTNRADTAEIVSIIMLGGEYTADDDECVPSQTTLTNLNGLTNEELTIEDPFDFPNIPDYFANFEGIMLSKRHPSESCSSSVEAEISV